ncbi:hypothetical protein ACLOJK_004137 [Asimina triloba]
MAAKERPPPRTDLVSSTLGIRSSRWQANGKIQAATIDRRQLHLPIEQRTTATHISDPSTHYPSSALFIFPKFECNPQSTNNSQSPSICISDDAQFMDPDPGHSFEAIKQQVFGSGPIPSMSGFIEQALTMSPASNPSQAAK